MAAATDRPSSILIPLPPITLADRIKTLQHALDPNDPVYLPDQQRNIQKVIQMYERGELLIGQEVYVMDGEVVTRKECERSRAPCFREVVS